MEAKNIMKSEEFRACEKFHGHICPGLSIGYRAAKIGLEELKEKRALDEELVTIVETDACCADAIQVLTGCTFGKGNFIYRDHGKMAFTFFSRKSGKGIRLSMRGGAFSSQGEHSDLLRKVMAGEATEDMKRRFKELHLKRSCDVLEMHSEELFVVSEVTMPIPEKARMEPSEPCDICGEATMKSKLVAVNGKKQCRGCLASG